MADCEVWLSGVELALSEFSNLDLLPSRILLCGGGSNLPEIKEVLNSKSWYKNLPFAKKPQIHFIKPTDLKRVVDKTGLLKGYEDVTPAALANLVLDMTTEEDLLPSLLRKAIRLIQT